MPTPDRRPSRRQPRRGSRPAAALLALLALLPVADWAVPAAGAADGTRTATDALAAARSEREAARADLSRARADVAAARARVDELGARDAELTARLARARGQVRDYAVAAYIDGGRTQVYLASLSPADAGALAWRTGLVAGSTVAQGRAVEQYSALREDARPERVAAAAELDRAGDGAVRAESAFLQATAVERDAEAELLRIQAAAAAEAARRAAERDAADRQARAREASARQAADAPAVPTAPTAPAGPAAPRPVAPAPSPPPGGPDGATPAELALLARIRQCESRGNYAAVSASGTYRGAYQFSVATWRAMGGSGDPAAAPPAEQDQRALALLRRQGPRAWPVCAR